MEFELLKLDRHLNEGVELNIVISTGQHLYRVEFSRGKQLLGALVRHGRPLMFRSLEGVVQTLRSIGFKRANLIEEKENVRGRPAKVIL